MILTSAQIENFNENGFLLIQNVFTQEEMTLMLEEMEQVIIEDCPRRILEKSGYVRSFFAPEASNEFFARVIRQKRVLRPAMQLLESDVYAHQTKLNTKHALVGDWWDWHQDYTFWKKDDAMLEPTVLTAMIFLNEVTEFNGPLFLIPGSHKAGMLESGERNIHGEQSEEWFSAYQNSTKYMSALTADLKYTLEQKTIASWIERQGIYSAKGAAGSVLFFHGNVFHASPNNLSPWHRHTFLITYNSTANPLQDIPEPRPGFIASRNFTPIRALDDDSLVP